MAFEVIQIQSLTFLPCMKPLCYDEMMLFIIEANLAANIFDMILNLKLANAIGLYCPTVKASGTFGINTKKLSLKLGRIQSFVKR